MLITETGLCSDLLNPGRLQLLALLQTKSWKALSVVDVLEIVLMFLFIKQQSN